MKSTMPIEILHKIDVICRFKTQIRGLSNVNIHYPSIEIQ